ncbi:MAG: hypothetical protein RR915_09725 [Cellulosilyticaceae bacterium]
MCGNCGRSCGEREGSCGRSNGERERSCGRSNGERERSCGRTNGEREGRSGYNYPKYWNGYVWYEVEIEYRGPYFYPSYETREAEEREGSCGRSNCGCNRGCGCGN